MFLSHKFLRYGKPLAAAAPIMLALSGLPTPAHACTGSPDDPPHCMNAGQAIAVFTTFFNNNLAGIPGSTGVPGDTVPGGALGGILEGFSGLGGVKPGDERGEIYITGTVNTSGETRGPGGGRVPIAPNTDDGDVPRSGIRLTGSGRFGIVYVGSDSSDGQGFTVDDTEFVFHGASDNGLTFGGIADNGLEFGGRIRLDDEPETAPTGPGISVNGRIDNPYFGSFLTGYGDGGIDASDIDDSDSFRLATGVADNGLRFNPQIQFESTGDDVDFDPFVSGSFGSIRLDADSSNRAISLGAPDDFSDGIVFRPQITLDNGLSVSLDYSSGVGAAGGIPEGSDQPNVKYFNPRFAGFQLGVNYARDGNSDTGTENLNGATASIFDIGANYVNSFGGINPALSDRWGIDSAATNFAVGQSSVDAYGNIDGVKIGRIDYVPLDEFGLSYQHNLGGGVSVVTSPSGSTGGPTGGSSSTSGENTPPPVAPPATPEPIAGIQVGTMSFANAGQRSEVTLIRTEDGKTHAVDSETGHDFGTVHESSSGFGWSFDNPPVAAPVAAPATTTATAPPEQLAGIQVGSMSFANQGQRSEVTLIRTEDGKTHAVDSESGHDFGTVHESRSGFGWSFDSPPVAAPTPSTPATQDPISALDREAIFTDGFESGDTTAWTYNR